MRMDCRFFMFVSDDSPNGSCVLTENNPMKLSFVFKKEIMIIKGFFFIFIENQVYKEKERQRERSPIFWSIPQVACSGRSQAN